MTAQRFHAPDLSQLPPPRLIEEVSYEAILAAQKTWVLARWDAVRAVRPDLPPLDTLGLDTEPMTIILEAFAFRETLMRSLVNDKARAVLLAYATGTDLDHVGALYPTSRQEILPADATLPAIDEADNRFRRRIQLTPEAFSVAGPRGAFIYFALSYSMDVFDAWAYQTRPGEVVVVVAGEGGADVSDAVLAGLIDLFGHEDIKPLTDAVQVRRARRVPYDVTATLEILRGPDPDIIEAAATNAVSAYAASRNRIAIETYRTAITAALQCGGVEDVILASPAADIICEDEEIPVLGAIDITMRVLDQP